MKDTGHEVAAETNRIFFFFWALNFIFISNNLLLFHTLVRMRVSFHKFKNEERTEVLSLQNDEINDGEPKPPYVVFNSLRFYRYGYQCEKTCTVSTKLKKLSI